MLKNILLILFVFLTLNVFGKVEEKSSYPIFRYLFKNKHEARTRLTNRINITYRIPKKINSGITHIQFTDIKLKIINKNVWLDLSECTQSKRMPVKDLHTCFHTVKHPKHRECIGVKFEYGNDDEGNHDTKTGYLSSYMKGMEDFDDYLATFTVKCFNKEGVTVFSRDMEVLQSRYYQKKKFGIFHDSRFRSWTPGTSYVYIIETEPFVRLETDHYYSRNRTINVEHYGKFVIKENKIIFEEDVSKRIAYYQKFVDHISFVNERGERDSKTILEKVDVNAKKYPYINIYDSDYYSSKKK